MSADNNVVISVKDLKKYYNGEEIKALDGITTDIKKGTHCEPNRLVAESCCGKELRNHPVHNRHP